MIKWLIAIAVMLVVIGGVVLAMRSRAARLHSERRRERSKKIRASLKEKWDEEMQARKTSDGEREQPR